MHTQDFPGWECLLGLEISVVLIAVVQQYIIVLVAQKFLPRHTEGRCLMLIYFIFSFLGHFYLSVEVQSELR